jgi:G3E family GTPase
MCQGQIASADVILLNKVDLMSTSTLDQVERVVRSINSTLRVHRTERSKVALRELFNIRAFSTDSGLRNPASETATAEREHDHHDDYPHDHVHSDMSTVLVPLPPLSTSQFDKLNAFLEALLWEGKLPSDDTSPAPEILRTKGYVTLQDGRSFILQGVTDIFELKELPRDQAEVSEVGEGKLVFIGKDVSSALSRAFRDYLGL